MMWKIQSKIKDSNLRNIDHVKKNKTYNRMNLNGGSDDEDEEEKNKFESPYQRSKRNRTNSINYQNFSSSFNKTQLPKGVFASISAALSGEDPND